MAVVVARVTLKNKNVRGKQGHPIGEARRFSIGSIRVW